MTARERANTILASGVAPRLDMRAWACSFAGSPITSGRPGQPLTGENMAKTGKAKQSESKADTLSPESLQPFIFDPRWRPPKSPEPEPTNLQELKDQIRRWILIHATVLRLEPAENPPDASGIFPLFNRQFFELTGYCIQNVHSPFDGLTTLENLCETLSRPITLTEFLMTYCGIEIESVADGHKKTLQNAMSKKASGITLPERIGKRGKGRTDCFRVVDLLKRWPDYKAVIPNLPMPVKTKVLA